MKSCFSFVWFAIILLSLPIVFAASKDSTKPMASVTRNMPTKNIQIQQQKQPLTAADSEARFKALARKVYPEKFKNVK